MMHQLNLTLNLTDEEVGLILSALSAKSEEQNRTQPEEQPKHEPTPVITEPATPAPTQQSAEQQTGMPAWQAPTADINYTLEQLTFAAAPLVDAGRTQELIALLNKFGIQAMTGLKHEQYGAFATELRALGAQI